MIKKRNLILFFLIFSTLYWQKKTIHEVSASIVSNECGGDRILNHRVGDYCSTNLNNGCCVGIIACQTENSLMCVPACNITIENVLESKKTRPECFNDGFYNSETNRCQCRYPYTAGRYCETMDRCAFVDCGINGHCSDGTCVCDYEFEGDKCQINKNCGFPNKHWDGYKCSCAKGYEGLECNECVQNLLCIPTKIGTRDYTPLVVTNPELYEFILSSPPPEGYIIKPFSPSLLIHQCSCDTESSYRMASSSSSSALVSLTENFANFHQKSEEEYHRFVPKHADYVQHLYEKHYIRPDECEFSFYFWIVGSFTFVTLFLFVLFCYFQPIRRKHYPNYSQKTEKNTEYSPVRSLSVHQSNQLPFKKPDAISISKPRGNLNGNNNGLILMTYDT